MALSFAFSFSICYFTHLYYNSIDDGMGCSYTHSMAFCIFAGLLILAEEASEKLGFNLRYSGLSDMKMSSRYRLDICWHGLATRGRWMLQVCSNPMRFNIRRSFTCKCLFFLVNPMCDWRYICPVTVRYGHIWSDVVFPTQRHVLADKKEKSREVGCCPIPHQSAERHYNIGTSCSLPHKMCLS
jgi:hypothetical protein